MKFIYDLDCAKPYSVAYNLMLKSRALDSLESTDWENA